MQVTDSENPDPGEQVCVAVGTDRVLVYRADDGGLVGTTRVERAADEW